MCEELAEVCIFTEVFGSFERCPFLSDYFFDAWVVHGPNASGFLVDSVTSVFPVLDEDFVEDVLVVLG